MDFVVPAKEYTGGDDEEIDQTDVENQDRMKDDVFEEVEIVAKKDKEIENLKHINSQQLDRIRELEKFSESTRRMEDSTIADTSSTSMDNEKSSIRKSPRIENKRTESQSLPTQFKRIKFKVFGSPWKGCQ